MGLKLVKSEVKFSYYPLPQQSPDTILYYKRIQGKVAKELREKYGHDVFNPTTKTYDFQIKDDVEFGIALLGTILVGWEGIFDENEKPIDFSRAKECFELIPPWMLRELLSRALGAGPEGDVENLLIAQQKEDEAKNS